MSAFEMFEPGNESLKVKTGEVKPKTAASEIDRRTDDDRSRRGQTLDFDRRRSGCRRR